jgi:hypothetical protein
MRAVLSPDAEPGVLILNDRQGFEAGLEAGVEAPSSCSTKYCFAVCCEGPGRLHVVRDIRAAAIKIGNPG